jgi:hypothetical protein
MTPSEGSGQAGRRSKGPVRKGKALAAPSRVPPRQWELKAGYRADGSGMLSLRDLLAAPETDTRGLSDLTEAEQAELTAERIRGQRTFRIELVGVGVLDKERAIAEVRALSSAGRTLIEIEKRALRMVIEDARTESLERATP